MRVTSRAVLHKEFAWILALWASILWFAMSEDRLLQHEGSVTMLLKSGLFLGLIGVCLSRSRLKRDQKSSKKLWITINVFDTLIAFGFGLGIFILDSALTRVFLGLLAVMLQVALRIYLETRVRRNPITPTFTSSRSDQTHSIPAAQNEHFSDDISKKNDNARKA
jgi:hypothetical protein